MSDTAYDASRHKKAGRGRVYDSIIDTIGDTPLVRLPNLSREYQPKATSWSSSIRWPRSRTGSAWP
jgi:cysteine synthase A